MRRLVISSMLVSIALVLSYVERLIPIGFLLPLPGLKLGLANIVTIFALFYMGTRSTLLIIVLRCFIANLLFGNMISFTLSISGALFALMVMIILKRGYGKMFSLIGISIGGAAAHSIGQILAAAMLLQSTAVFPYLSMLMPASIITGIVTALASNLLIERFKHIEVKI